MQRGAPFVWGHNKIRVFRNGENSARRAAWVRAFWLPRRHLTTGGTRLEPKVEAGNESGPGYPGAGSHLAGRICIWLSRPGSERCGQAGTAAANASAVAAQWVLYGVPSPRAESARVPQVRRIFARPIRVTTLRAAKQKRRGTAFYAPASRLVPRWRRVRRRPRTAGG